MEEQQTVEVNEETPKNPEEVKKPKDLFGDFMEICESVITSIFVVLIIFTFICRPVTVDGKSMNPTLQHQDKLLLTTFLYTPKVGDIVVLENNKSNLLREGSDSEVVTGFGLNKKLVKRVIAEGGQTVDIDFENGIVTVDGEQLSEDYINAPTHFDSGAFDYPVTVPEGYVFVMGDNRNASLDSRAPQVGFVKNEDVLGKAVLRFYPFENLTILE